ncbi:MAG: GAF domain-containing protein, partial [Spirochaetia bacterium]|nr:GAF domain-containing protein [Spirochaetia bacterium]
MKLNIKKILSRNDVKNILDAFYEMHSGEICIVNEEGQTLYGENLKDSHFKTPISANGNIYGEIHSNKDSSSFCSLMNLLIQNEMEKKSLAQETLERYKEIKLFEKISERITANLSLGEVADLIIQETSNLIQADNVSIMLFNSQMQQLEVMASSNYTGKMTKTLKPGEGIGGSVFLSGRGEIVNDLTLDPRFIKGDGSIQSMMCVPLKIDQDVFGVMNLISREKVNYAAGDLNVFSMIASQAAIAIENANHIRSLTENAASRERIESELNIAKKIQSSLLPHQNYSSGNGFPFSINASMYHAAQVGGDFYEYFLFDEEHLCFAIGDVAGKGIPAAIFMAVTKTLLKSCVNLYKTPGKILY